MQKHAKHEGRVGIKALKNRNKAKKKKKEKMRGWSGLYKIFGFPFSGFSFFFFLE